MDRRHLLGMVGSVLLFVGVFMPIVSMPLVGGINYFNNGKGDGLYILILAGISIILTTAKLYKWLWGTASIAFLIMFYDFFGFILNMSNAKTEMEKGLANNPFKGFGEAMMQSVQLQWGWAILFIGVVLLLTSAAMTEPKNRVATGAIEK